MHFGQNMAVLHVDILIVAILENIFALLLTISDLVSLEHFSSPTEDKKVCSWDSGWHGCWFQLAPDLTS